MQPYVDPAELARSLESAIRKKSTRKGLELIAAGADVNFVEEDGDLTLLMFAAERGLLEVAKALVDAGANVNALGQDFHLGEAVTALFCAAAHRHRAVYEYLAPLTDPDEQARAEQHSAYSRRPRTRPIDKQLIDAAGKGQLDAVTQLLRDGANVNANHRELGNALCAASAGGHTEIVDVLLKAGADVGIRTREGVTPLWCAANAKIVDRLLSAGADVNTKTNYRVTGLMVAVARGESQIVQTLVANGADVNAKDKMGGSALMSAARRKERLGHDRDNVQDYQRIIRVLCSAGADVRATDCYGRTAYQIANHYRDSALCEVFAELGADK